MRVQHLKVGTYERGEARDGQANGFKPRGLQTSFGKLNLNVPQVRGSSESFQSNLFEKGCHSDRALKVAIAEMYLQGVSTRRVTTVMEKLCGMEVTSCQVSRLTAELNAEFQLWRNRLLPEIAFIFLDPLSPRKTASLTQQTATKQPLEINLQIHPENFYR